MANEWSDNQKWYCLYVIGTVESRCDYAAVNLYDAITLGITQWWGYNAARLLEKIKAEEPESFEQLSDRVKNAVNSHPSSDTGFWPNFYLYNDDAEAFKRVAQADEIHALEDELFMGDVFGDGGNLDVLASWGVDTTKVKESIFLLSAYHQRPASCANVVRNIGGNRSLDNYLSAVLNDGVLYAYSNRYNEVYSLLAEWDGTSAPPDFGQSGDPTDNPDEPDTDGQLSSQIKYIQSYNLQDLIVYGAMGTTERMICYYQGNGTWRPRRNTAGPSYPSTGGGEGGGGNLADFEKIKALTLRYENAFQYAMAPGRLDPLASGYTDCSAFVWWSANHACDNKYTWLGTSTYTQRETAQLIYRSEDGSIPQDVGQPGDIIITGGISYDQHVAYIWDDGSVWGAGWAPCPKMEYDDYHTCYIGMVLWAEVYRFLSG